MNKTQTKRWKQVAKGMCFEFWPDKTEARKQRLWSEIEGFIDEISPYEITSWEGSPHYPCDWFQEYFEDYQHDILTYKRGEAIDQDWHYSRFYNQMSCIARASIDVMTNTGGLVWGFDVDTLKRIFGGRIPKWVLSQYEDLTNETLGHLTIAL